MLILILTSPLMSAFCCTTLLLCTSLPLLAQQKSTSPQKNTKSTRPSPAAAQPQSSPVAPSSSASAFASPTAAPAPVSSLSGRWSGALNIQGTQLPLVLVISVNGSILTASLDSPQQGAFGLEASSATFADGKLTVRWNAFNAFFEGNYAPQALSERQDLSAQPATDSAVTQQNDSLIGRWHQGGGSLPLVFVRQSASQSKDFSQSAGSAPMSVNRPQTPKAPFPYSSEEVRFASAQTGITLSGTLTMPAPSATAQKPPVVILVSGSGQHDRDETILYHKPFAVIADHLSRHGIAVLRYDDRGIGGSNGVETLSQATTKDFALDAQGAYLYLQSRSDVDVRRIGIIGHSEGAIIASMLAAESATRFAGVPPVACLVLLAGTGTDGAAITVAQTQAILTAQRTPERTLEQTLAIQRELTAVVRDYAEPAGGNDALLRARLAAILERAGMDEATRQRQIAQMMLPWVRFFWSYNPQSALERVRCPVLALGGSNDVQVPAQENLRLIAEALERGNNRTVTTKEFPLLNHLFQTSRTGLMEEYGVIEETIAPVVLEELRSWLSRIFGISGAPNTSSGKRK